MKATEVKKLKTALIKELRTRGTYQKETDDILIDTLLFNLELIREAKIEIQSRGQMGDIGNNKQFYQINFSVSILHNAVKSVNSILKQLGLEKPKAKDVDPKEDALSALNEIINRKKTTSVSPWFKSFRTCRQLS
jgi:hypothetical protein